MGLHLLCLNSNLGLLRDIGTQILNTPSFSEGVDQFRIKMQGAHLIILGRCGPL